MDWHRPAIDGGFQYAPVIKKFSGLEQIPEVNHKYLERVAGALASRAQGLMQLNRLQQYLVHAPVTLVTGEQGTMWVQVIAGAVGVPMINARLDLRRVRLEEEEEETFGLFYFCHEHEDASITRHILDYRGGWSLRDPDTDCKLPTENWWTGFKYWTGRQETDVVSYMHGLFYGWNGELLADITTQDADHQDVFGVCRVKGTVVVWSKAGLYTLKNGEPAPGVLDEEISGAIAINQSGTEFALYRAGEEPGSSEMVTYALSVEDGLATTIEISAQDAGQQVISETDERSNWKNPSFPTSFSSSDSASLRTDSREIITAGAYHTVIHTVAFTVANPVVDNYQEYHRTGAEVERHDTVFYHGDVQEWPLISSNSFNEIACWIEPGDYSIRVVGLLENWTVTSVDLSSWLTGYPKTVPHQMPYAPEATRLEHHISQETTTYADFAVSWGWDYYFAWVASGPTMTTEEDNVGARRRAWASIAPLHLYFVQEEPPPPNLSGPTAMKAYFKDQVIKDLGVKSSLYLDKHAYTNNGYAVMSLLIDRQYYLYGYANGELTDITALVGGLPAYDPSKNVPIFNLAPISAKPPSVRITETD